MLEGLRSLPRTVWLIGLISLVNDAASDMLYPLIPLYLSSVLMAGPRVLGLIEGVAEATASLLKLLSGVIMDRTRRARPWMLFGYGLAGLGRPLIAFVSMWPWLMAIRFVDRAGKGLRSSPRDALLAASVAPDRRGLAFGLHRAMDNGGAVIGPLVAAALLAGGMSLKSVFLWSAVPAVLCVLLVCAIREVPTARAPAAAGFDWQLRDLPRPLRRYLLIVALFALGNSSNMFLLLRAGELGMPAAQLPLLWAAVALVATLFTAPLSALSDRLGRVRMLVCGYGIYAIVYFAIGMQTRAGLPLILLFIAFGLFLASTEGVEKALVADLAPATRRGTAFGWFNLASGFMLLPASALFGLIYHSASPFAAFAFASGCALLAATLLWYWLGPDPASPRG